MQGKCNFDEVGDAVAGEALALLVLERLGVAACGQDALPEMVDADDAEQLRVDRLAVSLHRRQELGDADAVDLIDAEELRQRLMRAADLIQYLAPDSGAGQAAKLGKEFPHRALKTEIAIAGHMRSKIPLQPLIVVPMRRGGIAR